MRDPFDDTPESAWSNDWRRPIDGPLRNTFRVMRAQFRERCAAEGAPCHCCEEPIDYGLRHGDPRAFELDHLLPVSVDESLALEPSNSGPPMRSAIGGAPPASASVAGGRRRGRRMVVTASRARIGNSRV